MSDEPRFIDCRLKLSGRSIGTTTRPAVLVHILGSALHGPARFPVWAPELGPGERRRWMRGNWVIFARSA